MRIFRTRFAVILHDLFMTWLAWMISYIIRYSIWVDAPELDWFGQEFAMVIVVQGIVAYYFNLYGGLWRFASIPDLFNIAKSAIIGTFIIGFVLFLTYRADGVPRSVLLMYPLILMVLWGVPRLTFRLFKDSKLNLLSYDKKKVLLIGAGSLADMFIRHSLTSSLYNVVGIVDDKEKFKGTNLRGVNVLGQLRDIEQICFNNQVQTIVITQKDITSTQMKLVVDNSMTSQCQLLTLPNFDKMTEEKGFEISNFLPVTITDLLGREKISIDWSNVAQKVQGKSILITGGGGSIGSELARQLVKLDLKSLCIIDHSEYNLYKIDYDLSNENKDLVIKSLLVNVTDKAHLFQVFSSVRPDIVFHAAAYKHVPLLEKMPCEGFINNVVGTKNVVDTCDQFNIEKMVLVLLIKQLILIVLWAPLNE